MTHGDALLIMQSKGETIKNKLDALDFIISNEYETDCKCIRQPVMWDLLKMVYKEYKKALKRNNNGELYSD